MKDYSELKNLKYEILVRVNNAYEKGYNQGIADGNINGGTFAKKVNEAYNNGAKDAWECAREISLLDSNFASVEEVKNIVEVFGTYNVYDILHYYTPQGAIKSLKDYEKKQNDEIKVGDEVYNLDPENVRVVTAIYNDDKGYKQAVQICKNGKYAVDRVDTLKKTGKHYDGIESILDQMRTTNERND